MIMRVLKISFLFAVPVTLAILVAMSIGANKKKPCLEMKLSVQYGCGHHFINPENLKKEIFTKVGAVEGHPLRDNLLREIKETVKKNDFVKNTEVFRTIEGNINVNITQRRPLIRVFNKQGKSYYLDSDGKMMPLSNEYTARVLIAGGHLELAYSPEICITQLRNSPEVSSSQRILVDLFDLASFIDRNSFWNAYIDYIHVLPSGKFELSPKNGAHVIEFGEKEKMEEKFEKLEVFYKNGMTAYGWEEYKKINVKYKNQVVCSK